MTSLESEDFFDELFRSSADLVYSYARVRLGPDEADDVTGEVFAAALAAVRSGRVDLVNDAWLMAVARNKVVDRWRRASRRMAKAHLLRPTQNVDVSTDILDRVQLALDSLSPIHRAYLVLHYIDGHPMTEVADICGVTTEAARSGLARARRSLAAAFEKVNVNA